MAKSIARQLAFFWMHEVDGIFGFAPRFDEILAQVVLAHSTAARVVYDDVAVFVEADANDEMPAGGFRLAFEVAVGNGNGHEDTCLQPMFHFADIAEPHDVGADAFMRTGKG